MRILKDTYLNNDQTLRIRTEQDSDAEHPRKEAMTVGNLVAKHSRYNLGDKDALSDLRDELSALVPDGFNTADEYVTCPTCHNDNAHEQNGEVTVCDTCHDDGDIENPHYLDDDSAVGIYNALIKLDPDEERIFWLPVYMYEHGNIALSTAPFSCPWDSGQVGFIWVTKKAVQEIASKELSLEELRQFGHRLLEGEIETYSQYLSGEVYGFICERYIGEEGDGADRDDDNNWEEEDSCWGFFGMDMLQGGMLDHLSEKYRDVFCEAEGITRDQLKEEGEAFATKILEAI